MQLYVLSSDNLNIQMGNLTIKGVIFGEAMYTYITSITKPDPTDGTLGMAWPNLLDKEDNARR